MVLGDQAFFLSKCDKSLLVIRYGATMYSMLLFLWGHKFYACGELSECTAEVWYFGCN